MPDGSRGISATKSYDFGRYQASLNGVKLGDPLDLYSAEIANEEYHLLDFWPEPGVYTLRLECTGKNPQSSGHFLGIESVRLRERRIASDDQARRPYLTELSRPPGGAAPVG